MNSWYNSKHFWKYYWYFVYDFLMQNCPDTSRPKYADTFRRKYVASSCKQYA